MIPGQQSQAPFHSASLYVGDLNHDVTEALLFEIFNAVGPVASIRVCRDAITRRSLGYAYVNFHNVADAERALDTMNYTMIKGRPCRIMWSQRDPSLRKSGVGNVFVKNLQPSIDNKMLYDTFSLFGNILSCKVAQDGKGESKGYGYVHYETAEAAMEAIAKTNGNEIEGKQVFVGHFQRRTERSGASEWTNCYVKNIPAGWDSQRLGEMFAKFGEVTSAVAVKGRPRRKEGEEVNKEGEEEEVPRGFGFVNFAETAHASAAVEALNGVLEDGKQLYVGRAQKRSERDQDLRARFQAIKQERLQKYQGVNLYVKNLDDAVTDDKLRAEFSTYGSITSAKVMMDSGRSKGFGFVCFNSPEEANEALVKVNGKLLEGKPVYVALAQRADVRRSQLEAAHTQQRASLARGQGIPLGQPPMYGAAPAMYYQGGPGMPGGPRGAFMYPQQQMMMARGPRGPMPGGFRGPNVGYQMPAYGVPMPGQQAPGGQAGPVMNVGPQRGPAPRGQHMQQGGQQGPRTQRGPQGQGAPRQQGQGMQQQRMPGQGQPMQQQQGGPGPQQTPGGPGAAQGNRNFKYTSNARNQPGVAGPMTLGAAPAAPVLMQPAMMMPPMLEPLSAATLAAASPDMQKNLIGERLYPLVHVQRPDLAGKITGMLLEMDNGELLHLLESPEDMAAKVALAVQVLNEHATTPEATE